MPEKPPRKRRSRSSKATIFDIAREAGVSTGTVSRALNNSDEISADTREKVLEISRRLGVRRRSSIKRMHFAVVIPAASQATPRPGMDAFVYDLMIEFSIRGCAMTLFSEKQIESLRRGIFDGVFSVNWHPEALAVLNHINDTPVLILNRFQDHGSLNVVGWDHVSEGRIVGDYLFGLGHKRIAFLTPHPMNREANQLRLQGLREVAIAHGYPLDEGCIEMLEVGSPLYAALARIVACEADAIFVPGQGRYAMEVINLLQGVMGLRVPDDISVVGGESPGWSLQTNPPLTAVRVPYELIASEAMNLMLDLIQNKGDGQPVERLLNVELIERKSVRDRSTGT